MQHEQHRLPVTALAFWQQDVILAGEGSLLKAYDVDRKTLLAGVRIFEGQAIHGIVVAAFDESHIFIWGGQRLCFAQVIRDANGRAELKVGRRLEADDWILDAAFCDFDNGDSQVALVTAHNAFHLVSPTGYEAGKVEHLVPGSNCILYCAHARWLSGSQCLIASGTAFGDVIIWSCVMKKGEGKIAVDHQTHYTFSAHEGSVFGVQLSSDGVAQGLAGRQRVLATCSDDRSIRLWDISDLNVKSPTLTEQQRQTGFGTVESNDASAPPALARTMGHISRIWHVRFEQSPDTGDLLVLSFGEDASNITWAINASAARKSDLPYSLCRVDMQRAHNGKNLWSLAIKDSRIATGGADGAISLQQFSPAVQEQDLSSTASHGNDEVCIFRAYGFVSTSEVLASSDKGGLYLLNLAKDISFTKISDATAGLRGYSVMASIEGVGFVAGSDGDVYMYQHNARTKSIIARTGRKVAGLFAQQLSTDLERVGLLVTNMGRSVASLYYIQDPNSHHQTTHPEVIELRIPDGFVTTSFALAHFDRREIAFFGSRNGSIAAFDITAKDSRGAINHVLLSIGAHGGETVTKMYATGNSSDKDVMFLLSTGRDSTFAVNKISLDSSGPRMTTVHQVSLPFGSNIESLGFSTENYLWVWGFRNTQFVVFDIETQQEVMTVECGGAHRIWSFHPTKNGGTFIWTKASKMYHQTQSQLPCQMINAGSHGREIKCTAISPDDSHLIATGAEDTDIKLSTYRNGSFKCLHTLQKHNTGIQHLQWSRDSTYLFSSGGFEELFVWRITKNVPHIGIGVVCESKHPRSGTSDLRIMSFDAKECERTGDFYISTVYSDSTLKSWSYSPNSLTWILLASGDYLTSCLTQCLHLEPPNNTNSTNTLLTASTDGHIALWKSTTPGENDQNALRWDDRHKIHQNAILALTSCNLSDQSRLLITGGDDNAIGITRLVTATTGAPSCRTLLISRAHAAAVTALSVAKEFDRGGDVVGIWLLSASIDQRVKLWRIEVDLEREGLEGVEGVDVRLVENVFTSVADVSSMEVMPLGSGTGVVVGGVGMDVWKVEDVV